MSSGGQPIDMSVFAARGARIENVQQIVVNRPAGVGTVPFRVPPLPPYFVERPEIELNLLEAVCSTEARCGVLVAGAVHGIGGLGKSLLAAKLGHNPEVHARFPDGILWATLGQEPNLLVLLSDWIRELGDYEFQVDDERSATGHLQTLLRGKSCLLVIDDAWNAGHLKAFLVAGAPSQVLITTRNADIAKVIGAKLFNLEVMSEHQSLQLVTNMLTRPLNNSETSIVIELAKEVGYLPLALHLAAAQISDGTTWDRLLRDLRLEVARLEILKVNGRLTEYGVSSEQLKDYSLLASFNLSLQRLDETTRYRFAWLGVLAEDAAVDEGVCSVVWETTCTSAAETLKHLCNKALLYPSGISHDGCCQYRIHDLLHDTAKIILTSCESPEQILDIPTLGIALQDAHSAMLRRYLIKSLTQSVWHCIPGDGYIDTHLTWHMSKSGNPSFIHTLLGESGSDSRNGWFTRKEALGQTASFVHDVTLANDLLDSAKNRTMCLWRYALIFSTLNSLAERLPLTLIEALVDNGLWTVPQTLTYIRRMSDVRDKLAALEFMLSKKLVTVAEKPIVLEEALVAALKSFNYRAILRLAFHCNPQRRIELCQLLWRDCRDNEREAFIETMDRLGTLTILMPEIIEYASTVNGEHVRSSSAVNENRNKLQLLSTLAPHIPVEQRASVYEAAKSLMIGAKQHRQDWSHSWRIDDPTSQLCVAEIASRFGFKSQSLSLIKLRSVDNKQLRAKLQLRAARITLDQSAQDSLRKSAIASLKLIKEKKECVSAICSMASEFEDNETQSLWGHALDAAESLHRATERAASLSQLCRAIPQENTLTSRARESAIKAITAINSDDDRFFALGDFAVSVGDSNFWKNIDDPITATTKITSADTRCRQLARLAKCLPVEERQNVLKEAILASNELADYGAQAIAMGATVCRMSKPQQSNNIDRCLDTVEKATRTKPEESVDVIEQLLSLELENSSIQRIEKIAWKIPSHFLRVRAIAAVARLLPSKPRKKALRAAISSLKRISKCCRDEKGGLIAALRLLVPLLDGDLLHDVLAAASKFEFKYDYIHNAPSFGIANWIRTLAPALTHDSNLWDQAVETASQLRDNFHDYDSGTWYHHYKEHANYELVTHAPDNRIKESVEVGLACRGLSDIDHRDPSYLRMLISLLSRTETSVRDSVIRKIQDHVRQQFHEGLVRFDVATEVLGEMDSWSHSQDIKQSAALNLYRSVPENSQMDLLLHIEHQYPRFHSHIVAWLKQNKKNTSVQKEETKKKGQLRDFKEKSREDLLRAVPMFLERMELNEVSDVALSINCAIHENTNWWR